MNRKVREEEITIKGTRENKGIEEIEVNIRGKGRKRISKKKRI